MVSGKCDSKMKVVFRQRFIEKYVKGKIVLDLGSIEHDLYDENITKGKWLFGKLHQNAKKVIGIDILEEDIEKLRRRGYDIRYGDVENMQENKFNEEFDLIIAGELIEHLPNPGQFLKNLLPHMSSQTELLITTPNPTGYIRFFDAFIQRERVRSDHMAWHSTNTLRFLLEAYGYKVKESFFYSFISSKKRSVFLSYIRKFFYSLFPYLSDGLVVIAERKK